MKKDINTIIRESIKKYINEAETGSGRPMKPTEEQEKRYEKLDNVYNDYFKRKPFWIWAKVKDSAIRLPVRVMLRANFDALYNTKKFVSVRATLMPESIEMLQRKNIRWKEVKLSNNKHARDVRQPFGLEIGPEEIFSTMVGDPLNAGEYTDKYYDVITTGNLTNEEYSNLVNQEFERYQKEMFGESVKRKKSLRLTESQLRNMITKTINTFLNEELGQPVQSDNQELYDETIDINDGKPFNVFLQICDYGLRAMGSEKTITVFANNKDELNSRLRDIVKKITQEYGNDKTIYATITNENGKSINTILKK